MAAAVIFVRNSFKICGARPHVVLLLATPSTSHMSGDSKRSVYLHSVAVMGIKLFLFLVLNMLLLLAIYLISQTVQVFRCQLVKLLKIS